MNTEHNLVTRQSLSIFSIFSFDGFMYQVTGTVGWAGDETCYVIDAIEWDEDAVDQLVALDLDAVLSFDVVE
jgi:hypothetical protein